MSIAQTISEAIKEHTTAERVRMCVNRKGKLVAYVTHVEYRNTILHASSDLSIQAMIEIAKIKAGQISGGFSAPLHTEIELLDGELMLEITTVEIFQSR